MLPPEVIERAITKAIPAARIPEIKYAVNKIIKELADNGYVIKEPNAPPVHKTNAASFAASLREFEAKG